MSEVHFQLSYDQKPVRGCRKSSRANCPLCFKSFFPCDIDEHVNRCLRKQTQTKIEPREKSLSFNLETSSFKTENIAEESIPISDSELPTPPLSPQSSSQTPPLSPSQTRPLIEYEQEDLMVSSQDSFNPEVSRVEYEVFREVDRASSLPSIPSSFSTEVSPQKSSLKELVFMEKSVSQPVTPQTSPEKSFSPRISAHKRRKSVIEMSGGLFSGSPRKTRRGVSHKTTTPEQSQRSFLDLPQAPVFTPTMEEFKDPYKFIESIRGIGQLYGICKIIPPQEWLHENPTFLDLIKLENFCFETKVQHIHLLQHRPCGKKATEKCTQSSVPFYEGTRKFLLQNFNIRLRPLLLSNGEVDLYKLYTLVTAAGGLNHVKENSLWGDIMKSLLRREEKVSKQGSDLASRVESYYEVYLLPIEKQHIIQGEEFIQSLTQYQQDKDMFISSHQKNSNNTFSSSEEPNYGFGAGKGYTLSGFKRMANKYKKRLFPNSNFPDDVTHNQLEEKFWSIVERGEPEINVHYGSDLGVEEHGSGFTLDCTCFPESLDRNVSEANTCTCHWNANHLPQLPSCVLRYLPRISGITVPMMYVGMVFSCFCWHTEDHYLYSINYIHHGQPKTWYGVPSGYADKFEQVMRQKLPGLFEADPSLIYHLITMISPSVLRENGVPVYTTVHYPGEFMITFPQAYHAGFNHGFNIAESVNFASSDWLEFGRKAIETYSWNEITRRPVFSHEQLIFNALKVSLSDETLLSRLLEELLHMRNKEEGFLERIIQFGYSNFRDSSRVGRLFSSPSKKTDIQNLLNHEGLGDNQTNDCNESSSQNIECYTCHICECDCFLSVAHCTFCDRWSCLYHITEFCVCSRTIFQASDYYRQHYGITQSNQEKNLAKLKSNIVVQIYHPISEIDSLIRSVEQKLSQPQFIQFL